MSGASHGAVDRVICLQQAGELIPLKVHEGTLRFADGAAEDGYQRQSVPPRITQVCQLHPKARLQLTHCLQRDR